VRHNVPTPLHETLFRASKIWRFAEASSRQNRVSTAEMDASAPSECTARRLLHAEEKYCLKHSFVSAERVDFPAIYTYIILPSYI